MLSGSIPCSCVRYVDILSALLLVSGALMTIMFLATLLSSVEHFVNSLYVLSISSMDSSGGRSLVDDHVVEVIRISLRYGDDDVLLSFF